MASYPQGYFFNFLLGGNNANIRNVYNKQHVVMANSVPFLPNEAVGFMGFSHLKNVDIKEVFKSGYTFVHIH